MTETNETFQFDELSELNTYPKSLIRGFSKGVSGDILEVGSGVGNFTRYLAEAFPDCGMTMLEPNPDFCGQLRKRFPQFGLHPGPASSLPDSFQCDTIINVNVLEHIEDDQQELRTYHRLLAHRSGHVCLYLPARPELYAPIDEKFGHCRRYTKKELRRKLLTAGFNIRALRYSNFIGYFAWALEFKWRKSLHFSPWKIALFDRIFWPLLSRIEDVIPPPTGQSLLAIAQAGQR